MAILLALFLKIMSENLNVNTAGAGLHAVGDSQPSVLHQEPTFDKHHIQTMMQASSGLLSDVEQLSEDVRNRKAQQDDTHSKAPVQQDRVAEEEHQEKVKEEQQHDQPKNKSKRKRKHNSSWQENQKKISTPNAKVTFNKTKVDTKGKEAKETHSDDHDAASSPKSSHDGADDQKEVGLFSKPTPQVTKPAINEEATTEEEKEGSDATAKVAPRADVPANEGALEDDEDSDKVEVGVPSLANVPGAGEEEAQNDKDSSGETMDSIAKKRFNEWLVSNEKKVSDNEGSSNDLSEEDDDSDFRTPRKRVSLEGASGDDETFGDEFVYDDEEVDTATHEVPTNDEAPAKAPVLKRVSSKDAAQMLKDIFKNY